MKPRPNFLLAFALPLAAALSLAAGPCRADSWAPPAPEIYLSPDKLYRVRVLPRPLKDQLAYFSDKMNGREPAGAPRGTKQATARAIVERLDADGRWVTLWDAGLTNEVAPVEVLISDRGLHIVTLDNWHSVGYGSNVVAIHDDHGLLVRSLSLSDLLPPVYIEALSHSVSSIHWRGTPRIEGDNLIVPVVVPQETPSGAEAFANVVIRLTDGVILSGTSAEWQKARAAAQQVATVKRDQAEQQKRAFVAPLVAPGENTESAWHDYLREAFFRTARDWKDNTPATTVLRDPASPDYAASEGWLREELRPEGYANDPIAIASIAPFDFLAERMKAILADAPRGKLKGSRIYVVAPSAALPMLEAILAPTGGTVICLDPTQPIPQRPERLKRYLSRD
jgi:hypothetical protein